MVLAALAVAGSALPDSRIGVKQAEALRVMAQIDRLGHALDRATEAYNGASVRLSRIRASYRQTGIELQVAQHNLRVAERNLMGHLRQLYVSGSSDGTLEVILGARSLDDILTGLDVSNRIQQGDVVLIKQVTRFRAAVTRRRAQLRRARRAEERVVAVRAAVRARLANGLAQQRAFLAWVHTEIAQLRAVEAARRAQLAVEARARLTAQRFQEQQALRSVVVGATAESPSPSPSAGGSPSGRLAAALAGRFAGRGARDAGARTSLRLGSGGAGLLRLLGPRHLRLRPGRDLTPPLRSLAVELRHVRAAGKHQPGDLVFFENLGHVGIYVGAGQYIQAPQPGDVVTITPLGEPWSSANYYGAKRIVG